VLVTERAALPHEIEPTISQWSTIELAENDGERVLRGSLPGWAAWYGWDEDPNVVEDMIEQHAIDVAGDIKSVWGHARSEADRPAPLIGG
jgi:hypothetical protein